MAESKPKQLDPSSDFDEDDDFEIESDDEGEHGKITIPVAHFQSRFVAGKDEQAGRSLKDNVLDLDEDGTHQGSLFIELQQILADPHAKDALIRKLLEMNSQEKHVKKASVITAKVPEEKEVEYEGKHDPQNPENEADFNKAYVKVLDSLCLSLR